MMKPMATRLAGIIINSKNNPERVMLHAEVLSFLHPSSGKEITFKAHLPDDMSNLIEELKSGE